MSELEFKVNWSENPTSDLTSHIRDGYGVAFLSHEGEATTQHFFFHKCQNKASKEEEMKIIYLLFLNNKDPLIKTWSDFLIKSKITECHCKAQLFPCNPIFQTGYCHTNVDDIV